MIYICMTLEIRSSESEWSDARKDFEEAHKDKERICDAVLKVSSWWLFIDIRYTPATT